MKDAAITNIYFDSSLLVKLYHPEPGSREAAQLASCHRSISLSFIAEIELKNTLYALCGRRVLPQDKLRSALRCVDQDMKNGQLQKLHVDPSTVGLLALKLSKQFTPSILSRSLDILHVANALVAEEARFATCDQRQAKLAKAAGLEVEFLEIPL